jgi:GAF domain
MKMLLNTGKPLDEINMQAHGYLTKLKSLLSLSGAYRNVNQKLQELEAAAKDMFDATNCSILLWNKDKLKKVAQYYTHPSFGKPVLNMEEHLTDRHTVVPPPITRGRSLLLQDINSRDLRDVRKDSMFSPLISNSNVIGMIILDGPNSKPCFEPSDLILLEIVSLIIVVFIQIDQLHDMLKMNHATAAMAQHIYKVSGFRTVEPNWHAKQFATIIAKSLYENMTKAEFNSNHIIYVASELISELSSSLRKKSVVPGF